MLSVAIIDDEPWIVRGLEKSMDWAANGAEIVYSGTKPEEAIRLLLEIKPDVVLTDINMGSVSGIDLMTRLREGGLDCEFVVISGYDEFEYARQAMSLGVMHYLLKPLDRNELEKVMRMVFGKVLGRKAELNTTSAESVEMKDDRFAEMRQYVASHCTQPFSLSDLAQVYHYNPSYLSDLFKRNLGIGFAEFLNQCRLEQAMLLLTQTNKPIMEIAGDCGFSDACHFSKLFRKRYGFAPRDSRKKSQVVSE